MENLWIYLMDSILKNIRRLIRIISIFNHSFIFNPPEFSFSIISHFLIILLIFGRKIFFLSSKQLEINKKQLAYPLCM